MKYDAGEYDIAVIGAGHAGCEAALATARMGMKTLLFSISLEAVANMPCNPHIGGSSKGHLVREIDCLGGEMGKIDLERFSAFEGNTGPYLLYTIVRVKSILSRYGKPAGLPIVPADSDSAKVLQLVLWQARSSPHSPSSTPC